MRMACWITQTTHTHTHSKYVIHILSTAKIVTRTRLDSKLLVHCLSFLYVFVLTLVHKEVTEF